MHLILEHPKIYTYKKKKKHKATGTKVRNYSLPAKYLLKMTIADENKSWYTLFAV